MNKIIKIGFVPLISLAIIAGLTAGCNSEESTSTSNIVASDEVMGAFLDSAVQGLSYTCSSGKTGTTNANGQYTCKIEDNVSFAIGSYVLGSCKASTTITPEDLSSNNTIVANMVQLLQTLDTDNDPTNGIVLNSTLISKVSNSNIDLNATNFDTAMALHIGTSFVSEEDALKHFEETKNSLIKTSTVVVSDPSSITEAQIIDKHISVMMAPGDQIFGTSNDIVFWGNHTARLNIDMVSQTGKWRVVNGMVEITLPNGNLVYVSGSMSGTLTFKLVENGVVTTTDTSAYNSVLDAIPYTTQELEAVLLGKTFSTTDGRPYIKQMIFFPNHHVRMVSVYDRAEDGYWKTVDENTISVTWAEVPMDIVVKYTYDFDWNNGNTSVGISENYVNTGSFVSYNITKDPFTSYLEVYKPSDLVNRASTEIIVDGNSDLNATTFKITKTSDTTVSVLTSSMGTDLYDFNDAVMSLSGNTLVSGGNQIMIFAQTIKVGDTVMIRKPDGTYVTRNIIRVKHL